MSRCEGLRAHTERPPRCGKPKDRPSPPQPPTTHTGKAPRPADHHNSLRQEPSRKRPQGQCTSGHRQQPTHTSKRSRAQQPPHRPPPKPGSPGTHPTLRHQSNGRRGQVCTVFGVLLSIEVGDSTVGTSDEFLVDGNPAQLSASWKAMAVTGGTPILLPEIGPPDRPPPGRRTGQKFRRPGGTLSGFPHPGRGKRHPNEPHRCES